MAGLHRKRTARAPARHVPRWERTATQAGNLHSPISAAGVETTPGFARRMGRTSQLPWRLPSCHEPCNSSRPRSTSPARPTTRSSTRPSNTHQAVTPTTAIARKLLASSAAASLVRSDLFVRPWACSLIDHPMLALSDDRRPELVGISCRVGHAGSRHSDRGGRGTTPPKEYPSARPACSKPGWSRTRCRREGVPAAP